MVALNYDYPPFDAAKAVFAEDVLAEVVDLRAHGKSWEQTAKAVGWEADELRKAVKLDPNFAPALDRARDEVADETNDEGLAQLRALAASENPQTALEAHQIIRKYLVEQARNKTRVAVEQMRLQAALARSSAKGAKAQPKQEVVDEDAPRIDPIDGGPMCSIRAERELKEARAVIQQEYAAAVAEVGARVWLWAGDHRVHDHKPGPSDTPLQIIATTDAMTAGKRIFWAVPVPEPADPVMGPYLRPEDCKRVPPLEEEAFQLAMRRLKGEPARPSEATGGKPEAGGEEKMS